MSLSDQSYRVARANHSDTARNAGPAYRLASKGRRKDEDERLKLLESLLDPLSRQRREFVQRGWRCLEVGAGRGSLAVWLAKKVGKSGRVVATDIDLSYLKRLHVPNLEVRKHNILEDSLEVLDPCSFDLVSSRLMLYWLAGKQQAAIQRMVECLRPGGWLVDEDGDWGTIAPVDLSHPLAGPFQRTWQNGDWMASRGNYDLFFGRKLPLLFHRSGLENIRHEATAVVEHGGSPWAKWRKKTFQAYRAYDLARGPLTKKQQSEYKALLAPWDDPSFWFVNVLLHACWGQRPKHKQSTRNRSAPLRT